MRRDLVWQAEVGRRVADVRDALGLDQVGLAKSLGISQQRLNNYERGFRMFDIELAVIIARKHGVTMDFVYWGDLRGLPLHLASKLGETMIPTGHDSAKH